MYSVVIKKAERLFAAVDTVRAFPLFYYRKDDFFAITDFPDELRADNVPLVIDENKAVILSYAGFVTGNKTLLKDIFQIVAGGFICFEENILQNEFHTSGSKETSNLTANNRSLSGGCCCGGGGCLNYRIWGLLFSIETISR